MAHTRFAIIAAVCAVGFLGCEESFTSAPVNDIVAACEDYACDSMAVVDILIRNGLDTVEVEDVTTTEWGRITTLSLEYVDTLRLPPSLGSLSALKALNVRRSRYLTFPPQMVGLRSLVSLRLPQNCLWELPPQLFTLGALEFLDLYNNYIDELHAELGNLRALRILILDRNYLLTLPQEIGTLSSLEYLSVASNRLTTLPSAVTDLTPDRVDICRNYLHDLPPATAAWLDAYDEDWRECQR